jgi:hypothetical protein
MAAKKKNGTSNVTWNNPKPKASVGNPKPQSAADKKATEKANKNPQFTGKNVPVKKADKGFAGSGAPLAQGFALSQPTKPSNVANAALAVTALPGSGQVRNAVAKKVGKWVGSVADDASFIAKANRLNASGAGGKVSKTMTPFGPTLRSTKIGSPAEQSARMGNLLKGAEKEARAAGSTANKIASDEVVRGMNKAGKIVREGTQLYAANKVNKSTKKKSK